MSKRRQGKAKGGRAAWHHDGPAHELPPVPKGRYSKGGRDLIADGQRGLEMYFDQRARREKMAKLGFIEQKLTPAEMAEALFEQEHADRLP